MQSGQIDVFFSTASEYGNETYFQVFLCARSPRDKRIHNKHNKNLVTKETGQKGGERRGVAIRSVLHIFITALAFSWVKAKKHVILYLRIFQLTPSDSDVYGYVIIWKL
jgi:hypothetical protein